MKNNTDRLLVKTPGLTIRTDSNQLHDKDIDSLVSLFLRLQEITSDFVQPIYTKVLLKDSMQGGQAVPESNYLEVGLHNFKQGEIPFFTVGHEFGHLIFKNPKNLKSVGIRNHCNTNDYNEFFADLVGALSTGNPSIAKEESLRFFGRPLIGMGFLNDGPKPIVDLKKGLFPTPYDYFFSTRRLLWDYFLENGKSAASARTILRLTYKAIGKVLQRPDCANYNLPDQAKFDQVDRELFDEVSKQLKRRDSINTSVPPRDGPSPKRGSALGVR